MLLPLLSLLIPLAQARTVQIQTTDGLQLSAETTISAKAEIGVLFVHQLRRSSRDWVDLNNRLAATGFTTIAVDLRGHGRSAKAGSELTREDYAGMVADLEASAAWLRSQGVKKISCVGASIGANLCTRLGAKDPTVVNLVLLSPGLNFKGITSGDALQRYGDRPVLIVASDEDRVSKRAAGILEQVAKGQVHYELLQRAGHGTQMLTRSGGLIPKITQWLVGSFRLIGGDLVKPKALISYDGGPLKSTGKKLQIHQ
jgi:pimeloyl-ACP methyl ester carboxylesterase